MAVEFNKLQFTKNWNSSADFPTYEENEQKVRADMQFLHDETKEFINETLIPELKDTIENLAVPGAGDMLESIYDPERKRTDIYKYAEEYTEKRLAESGGGFDSFTEDNAPEQRGRYMLYGKILKDYREVRADG